MVGFLPRILSSVGYVARGLTALALALACAVAGCMTTEMPPDPPAKPSGQQGNEQAMVKKTHPTSECEWLAYCCMQSDKGKPVDNQCVQTVAARVEKPCTDYWYKRGDCDQWYF
jgi:hypothetical protein